ncbi:MAG TPA: sensor histidine kinase [Streptosporangiaceae bacterium]|nr:sensor histidine kinase [Streptosporangiaceae bacterium]
MPRTANWVIRASGLLWVGLLTFLVPSREASGHLVPYALPVQIAGFSVLVLAFLAWTLIEFLPAAAHDFGRWLAIVLGVMAVGAGFAAPAGGGGTAMVAFAFVAALIAGGDFPLTRALAVTLAGVLVIEVSSLGFSSGLGTMIGLPLVVLAGFVIGRNRVAYRIQAEQSAMLLAKNERLQAEHRRADLLDERARIAREIHDVLAHSLGALGIQIQAARSVLSKDPERAAELLAAAQQLAAEGLVETRRAVHALRTDTMPLSEELARVSDTYAQRYQVAVSFDTDGVPAALPPDATVALLRIAQEALVNAAKHASGQRVAVRLDYGEDDVRLSVRNDLAPGAGPGHEASIGTVNGGYGLTGMRERLRLLDGTLEAGRQNGQWVVTAELPRQEAEIIGS